MHKVNKLYQLLENSAEQFPDNTALVFQEKKISYQQLNSSVNQIKEILSSINITDGSRIAICSPKSIEFVASIFGILKAGAAYVPVDYFSPIERNKFIVENCEVAAIIITKDLFENFKEDFTFAADIGIDLVLAKNNKVTLKKSPEDLSYILYTSGSTGNPKGVMYSNAGSLEFINWSSNTFFPTSADCFSSHAPFHFDLSIFDLYVSIKHGATLVLIKEEVAKQPMLLAQLISEQKISIWYSTPSILIMLSEYGKMEKYKYDSLRLILFAGEIFPIAKFNSLKKKVPTAVFYNLYGPTETNVCTYYQLPENIETSIPIGKVCEHYQACVVDDELLISGAGVMLGYWNVPEKSSFWKDGENKLWYKTGDLVDVAESGDYIFKGRRDRMVKRNGYRIELDEIETGLSKHPDIVIVAVVGKINEEEQMIISAFVVLRNAHEKSVIKMKEYCMNHLPSYMVPNDFIFVENLPYTSSNKVDYQKLKQLV